ncbi:bifunctional riboflavin kinase/FAD synthetase [Salisediminibacterium halotolerans]|uniref:Riboflavin biosynthesis protein n=1 Tax=Salisediminibacterium halotolerans TaxID=517425 RepID=A0A1H9QAU3_9BACI|nr:bifunctional riboflavin kinase/FAD synthetase [Salisediminibacterium haloalkalitolerans]SER56943.1 riboflavin kinase / FMN adenylyltransferase [Salisediminibacterium haloalkalitolerans]
MEIIRLKHPVSPLNLPPISVALGFFDGVHLGHRSVIQKAKDEAEKKGYKSAVMTFYPHPKEVLQREQNTVVQYLTPLPEKEQLIADLNVDYLFIVEFDAHFAELSPQQFVDRYLIGLNIHHVAAGFDYTYGRLGKGTMETLIFHSRGKFTQTTVSEQAVNGEKISSTAIRNELKAGNVRRAAKYLGREFKLSGIVGTGDQRGRTIGFPTANIAPSPKVLIPAPGVYAVRFFCEGQVYDGVCNIGYKPTFNEQKPEIPTIEVHIFDFARDIYGEEASVYFIEYLRGEISFDSVDELIGQMQLDSEKAKEILKQ